MHVSLGVSLTEHKEIDCEENTDKVALSSVPLLQK